MRARPYFVSFPFNITTIDLAEFEDLYYASCAKLKELFNGVDILLTNGFRGPEETYFTYQMAPLACLGPINITDFRDSLIVHANFLYSQEVTDFLDKGVKRKNMRDNKYDSQKESIPRDDDATKSNIFEAMGWPMPKSPKNAPDMAEIDFDSLEQSMGRADATQSDIDNVPYFHPGIWGHREAEVRNRQRKFQDELRLLKNAKGLQDVSNMSCGMIFGMLAEKYRPMIGASINRHGTPEAPQASPFTESYSGVQNQGYISPYNLEERAKKLNNPEGPEKPCICDPDCMCAPLCASDSTQNCLCEENSLFARVTEGMDIDDLNVPDLVHRERQASESSGSSTASAATTEEAVVEEPVEDPIDEPADEPADDIAVQNAAADAAFLHMQQLLAQQIDQDMLEEEAKAADLMSIHSSQGGFRPTSSLLQLDDTVSIAGTIESAAPSESTWNEEDLLESMELLEQPMRTSSLAYREALRQPFSQLCPHPPKRASVAERFFGSANIGQKSISAVDKHKQSTSSNTGKVSKPASKISLPVVSFINLKSAIRRDRQARFGRN